LTSGFTAVVLATMSIYSSLFDISHRQKNNTIHVTESKTVKKIYEKRIKNTSSTSIPKH